MPDLHGKIALVTEGGSGLGHATARRLQADGATVVITDIQVGLGEAAATESGCTFLPQDVTAEADRLQVMNVIRSPFGGLRIWVNNAGVLAATQAPSPERTPQEDWRRLVAVKVDSVLLGCKIAMPAMRHTGNGSIINICSVAGLLATPLRHRIRRGEGNRRTVGQERRTILRSETLPWRSWHPTTPGRSLESSCA